MGKKNSNAIFVINCGEIKNIPADRKIAYGCLVVDYREQKKDPNRVQLTVGCNLIKYTGSAMDGSDYPQLAKILHLSDCGLT